jgi:hypothetical protein
VAEKLNKCSAHASSKEMIEWGKEDEKFQQEVGDSDDTAETATNHRPRLQRNMHFFH